MRALPIIIVLLLLAGLATCFGTLFRVYLLVLQPVMTARQLCFAKARRLLQQLRQPQPPRLHLRPFLKLLQLLP